MRKVFLIAILAMISISGWAQVPAFPGADGFGRYATGGRGGSVYYVTTLEDNNDFGSLRYGVTKLTNATILFKVSGTIHLNSSLGISGANLTIAGQSAPGDGICLADYPVSVKASNVIIRYMRFRMGDYKISADEADGGDAFGGRFCDNVIIDHCSVSWSTDECCSFYANTNFTMQWCLIAESLRASLHSKGNHGYGAIWGGVGASYYHNMLIHHDSRTPRFGTGSTSYHPNEHLTDWRNNVIYNWSGNGCYGCEGMYINTVNNYYRPGGATTSSTKAKFMMPGYATSSDGTTAIWGKYYFSGNKNDLFPVANTDNWKGVTWTNNSDMIDGVATLDDLKSDTVLGSDRIPLFHQHSTDSAYQQVLSYVGCCKSRDALDARYISECRNRTTTYMGTSGNKPGIIDKCDDLKPSDAGDDWTPWPVLNSTAAPDDTDCDGMPDEWEAANGLNPNDAADRNLKNDEGYTMLEVYLASLVEDITTAQYEASVEMGVAGEPYDPKEYSTEATVTFQMGTGTMTGKGTSDNTNVVTSATYSANGLTVGTRNKLGTVFTAFSPTGEGTSPSENACVTFSINIAEGAEVIPSSFSLKAVRCGTNGSSLDVVWIDGNGKQTTLMKNIKPIRDDGSGGTDPILTADLSELGLKQSGGICQLKFYIYNLAVGKQMGFADICLGLHDAEPNGITTIKENKDEDGVRYNLSGIRVSPSAKGILINNGRKVISR